MMTGSVDEKLKLVSVQIWAFYKPIIHFQTLSEISKCCQQIYLYLYYILSFIYSVLCLFSHTICMPKPP